MKRLLLLALTSVAASAQVTGFFERCLNTHGTIDCSSMNITTLPSDIIIHHEVQCLNLQQNAISEITTNTFYSAGQVETLDLSFNRIHFIGNTAFLAFENLIFLNLAVNQISSLPFHFLEGLNELRILDLTHNYLTFIPGEIFEATPFLQELKLSLNPIIDLSSETFFHLHKLEKLLIDHTNLKTLPANLFRNSSKHIQTLNIAHNLFNEIPPLHLPNLRALDLSFNHIQEIPPRAFEHCPKLSTLYINNNHGLSVIKPEAFSKLPTLRALHCSYNVDLKAIDPKAFYTNDSLSQLSLEQLHLRGNKFQNLPQELVKWNNLFYLDLRGNPWRCDCKLLWLRQLKLPQAFQEQMICKTPRRLYGQSLGNVPPEQLVCGFFIRWDVVIVLIGVLLASCSLAIGFILWVLFIRHQRSSSRYARIIPLRDRTDLEWDDSAEP